MSEEIKIKKNYKLFGTESDPVIIAQRLLNLYRQLHIFNQEKKEAYNKMLLEQTPEVKRTLGHLPGGIVLQQYLADIEEEAGLEVEDFSELDSASREEGKDGAKVKKQNQIDAPAVTIASDPEMIKGIVDAFKDAMITSEKNRKEDTKELAQTIVALQSKMTQTILGKNSGNVGGLSAQNVNMDEIISSMSKAQGELIKEVAQIQTKELSQVISDVLKEIQKISAQTFITALQAVNANGLDVLKSNLTGSVSMAPMQQNIVETFEEESKISVPDEVYDLEEKIDMDNSEDYEWEYVEESDELNTEEYEYVEVSDVEGSEYSEDYEWEYVEEDISSYETTSDTQIAAQYIDPYISTISENVEEGKDNFSTNDNESIDLGEDFGLYSS